MWGLYLGNLRHETLQHAEKEFVNFKRQICRDRQEVWKLFSFSLRIHTVLALGEGVILVFSEENIFSGCCENVRGTSHVNYAKCKKPK